MSIYLYLINEACLLIEKTENIDGDIRSRCQNMEGQISPRCHDNVQFS